MKKRRGFDEILKEVYIPLINAGILREIKYKKLFMRLLMTADCEFNKMSAIDQKILKPMQNVLHQVRDGYNIGPVDVFIARMQSYLIERNLK